MIESHPLPHALSLYVHWPFCASKCPYCDFNSHVRERIDHEAWTRAFLEEMRHYGLLVPGRRLGSIFFGGGTPSLMQARTVGAIIDEACRIWAPDPDIEITLEANPGSVEVGRLADFRHAGVNRVSIGVQSFSDEALAFLGRKHTVAESLAALESAAALFDRFSFDLIYALPDQSVAAWRRELMEALAYAGDHLSVYQLTIEEGTPFFTSHARGDFHTPDESLGGALYEATQEILGTHGLPAYEISNHAAEHGRSRHNLNYWRYGDYVGIGPGAHGRLTLADGRKIGTRGHRAPEAWLARVAQHGHGAHPFDEITPAQRASETLMMGLRLAEGVPLDRLESESARPWRQILDPGKLEKLEREGYLTLREDVLRLSPAGLQRLHGILRFLM